RTAPWNGLINSRQFSIAATWPTTYDYPDVIYDATHRLEAGDLELELTHARGETDDHTWIWWPARRILFTGDLFLWVAPNAGNPQKVQRHAAEWARALRAMAERPAELLVPGHGMPVFGAARVRQALEDTAEWLETLEHETVARMNAGSPSIGSSPRCGRPRIWRSARTCKRSTTSRNTSCATSGASTAAGAAASPRTPNRPARPSSAVRWPPSQAERKRSPSGQSPSRSRDATPSPVTSWTGRPPPSRRTSASTPHVLASMRRGPGCPTR